MDGGRYSKVFRRMWNDQKFRKLSRPQPCGQSLWMRLLCGPELGPIPGLIAVREPGLADAMGWALEPFRESFRELEANGLAKADWEAGLVWVPNAVRYNEPANPNVVKSWADAWAELPECSLKSEAYSALCAYLETRGESFVSTFRNHCPNHCPNQEQEQEQEQDQEGEGETLPPGPKPSLPAAPPDHLPPRPPVALPEPDRTEACRPSRCPVVRPTGHDLVVKFGHIRSEIFQGRSLPWNTARDAKGDAASFAALLGDDEVRDVDATMRLALEHIRDGAKGWENPRLAKDPSFAFGAWKSGFHGLREELHNRSPRPGALASRPPAKPVVQKWTPKSDYAAEAAKDEAAAAPLDQLKRELADHVTPPQDHAGGAP